MENNEAIEIPVSWSEDIKYREEWNEHNYGCKYRIGKVKIEQKITWNKIEKVRTSALFISDPV